MSRVAVVTVNGLARPAGLVERVNKVHRPKIHFTLPKIGGLDTPAKIDKSIHIRTFN